jgi:hypothetical protein
MPLNDHKTLHDHCSEIVLHLDVQPFQPHTACCGMLSGERVRRALLLRTTGSSMTAMLRPELPVGRLDQWRLMRRTEGWLDWTSPALGEAVYVHVLHPVLGGTARRVPPYKAQSGCSSCDEQKLPFLNESSTAEAPHH